MKLYTKKQFAELVNKPTNVLSVYIKRRKVIVENELIDPLHETNNAFLAKFGGNPVTNGIEKKEVIQKEFVFVDPDLTDEEIEGGKIMPLTQSERLYQHDRAIRTRINKEQALIELAAAKGELIPYKLIKPLFQVHNQSILNEFKVLIETQLRNLSYKYDIGIEDMAAINGKLNVGLNEAIDKAKKATAKGITNIVENIA